MPSEDERREGTPWWARGGVGVRDGRLTVSGRDAGALARTHGTPLYVHDLQRIGEQARGLRRAIAGAGLRPRVRLALKAQREPQVLAFVRSLGGPGSPDSVGIDACTPGEVEHAVSNGFEPNEISHTGTNLSDRDIDRLLAFDGLHVNLDLPSQLDRFGRRGPGREVGIRLNPRAGAASGGASESLYSSKRPTKFGFYEEDLDQAVAIARRHDLSIVTAHVHLGDGYLDDDLHAWDHAMAETGRLASRLRDAGCPIREVNTGGGQGLPLGSGQRPLDLDRWAGILARHLGSLDVVVGTEPGDYLVREAGVLLAEVVTVSDRGGTTFVGLDVGWNVMNDRFVYDDPVTIVHATHPDAAPTQRVTVSGNVNEGDDLFGEDVSLPDVAEGDILALLAVGGYNQAMYAAHTLRPPADGVYFDDRASGPEHPEGRTR
ncbi:MAG: diaminopimelate decarboxylase [Actinomycetota bacterium]